MLKDLQTLLKIAGNLATIALVAVLLIGWNGKLMDFETIVVYSLVAVLIALAT